MHRTPACARVNVAPSCYAAEGSSAPTARRSPISWVRSVVLCQSTPKRPNATIASKKTAGTVTTDLREIGPTYYFAPPAILERLLTSVTIRMEDAGSVKRNMFKYFMGVANNVGTAFLDPTPVSTSFPMVITSSAAFNDTLWRAIGDTVGTEARAFANAGHAGLTYWVRGGAGRGGVVRVRACACARESRGVDLIGGNSRCLLSESESVLLDVPLPSFGTGESFGRLEIVFLGIAAHGEHPTGRCAEAHREGSARVRSAPPC